MVPIFNHQVQTRQWIPIVMIFTKFRSTRSMKARHGGKARYATFDLVCGIVRQLIIRHTALLKISSL